MTREGEAIVEELEGILYDSDEMKEKHGSRDAYYEFHNRIDFLLRTIKAGGFEDVNNPDDDDEEEDEED